MKRGAPFLKWRPWKQCKELLYFESTDRNVFRTDTRIIRADIADGGPRPANAPPWRPFPRIQRRQRSCQWGCRRGRSILLVLVLSSQRPRRRNHAVWDRRVQRMLTSQVRRMRRGTVTSRSTQHLQECTVQQSTVRKSAHLLHEIRPSEGGNRLSSLGGAPSLKNHFVNLGSELALYGRWSQDVV